MDTNEIIARFMGTLVENKDVIQSKTMPDYKYNWELIMPVIDKIESLGFHTSISTESTSIRSNSKINFGCEYIGYDRLNNTIRAIIDFIQWINKGYEIA